MEDIVLLGATGSIGTQTLDILRFSFDYRLLGVSLKSKSERLEPYLLYFDHLKYVAIEEEEAAKKFKAKHPDYQVFSGKDCSLLLLKACHYAVVFNALMGNVGLRPSLLALRQNQDLLLSNKESLVIGSSLIQKALASSTSHLYPVDSEHVALAKLLAECKRRGIKKDRIRELIVTASGGSLRDTPIEELSKVTPEKVLHHPTWAMGKKITVDSATLVNKGYEVIEASVLFSFPLAQVNSIICRESLVHAEVIYEDEAGKNVTLKEYSPVDMKVSIAYALSKGKLSMHQNSPADLQAIDRLHFQNIDTSFYPLFLTTIDTYRKYANRGMIYYNEVDSLAIARFLAGEISFPELVEALRFCHDTLGDILQDRPLLTESNLASIEDDAKKEAEQILYRSLLFKGNSK